MKNFITIVEGSLDIDARNIECGQITVNCVRAVEDALSAIKFFQLPQRPWSRRIDRSMNHVRQLIGGITPNATLVKLTTEDFKKAHEAAEHMLLFVMEEFENVFELPPAVNAAKDKLQKSVSVAHGYSRSRV